jgi:hypothetical protein
MDTVESLNQSVWDCKYHVVFIPKCRRKALHGDLRQHLGKYSRRLAQQKESRIEEGHPPAALSGSHLNAPGSAGGFVTPRSASPGERRNPPRASSQ